VNVVIDTNLWISFMIGQTLDSLEARFLSNDVRILSSETQIRELKDVISRSKFKKYFSLSDRKRLESYLVKTAWMVDIVTHIEACRDPKDNFILDIAVNGGADYLVTGDEDLLVLGTIQSTRIVRFREFESILVE
jgi:putative PIN family toxin of toxin-antitoxin system